MDLAVAFAHLRTAFPKVADFQGTHFKFAERAGVVLIEKKRQEKFFYWLIWEGQSQLVHHSQESKLRPMRTIGDSFSLPQ